MRQDSADTVQVLALLPLEGDRQRLRDIFGHSNWRLRFAGTLSELQKSLTDGQFGVVITCSNLTDCGWKEVLESADRMEARPSVIVSSRLADDRLWAEVLNFGGFDVLAMPFEQTEVLRSVAMAWRGWWDRATLKPCALGQGVLGASA